MMVYAYDTNQRASDKRIKELLEANNNMLLITRELKRLLYKTLKTTLSKEEIDEIQDVLKIPVTGAHLDALAVHDLRYQAEYYKIGLRNLLNEITKLEKFYRDNYNGHLISFSPQILQDAKDRLAKEFIDYQKFISQGNF